MKHGIAFLIAGVITLGAAAPALAQQPATVVDSIRMAYERLDYETAVEHAQEVLDRYQSYRPEQLVEVHVILGAIRFAQDDQPAARRQFEQALSLQPDFELSELRYSPKIVQFFQQVKKEFSQREVPGAQETPGESSVRYLIRDDPRPQAALRSAVLPGAGQLYKGETAEGWTLALLWGSMLVGADLIDELRQQARKDYLDAGRGATAAPYDRYNTWHKTAEGLRLAAAVVWVYSMADALLDRQQPDPVQSANWQLQSTATGRPGLRLQLQF